MSSVTKLPVFFFGHGSPMNIVEENDFTRMLKGIGDLLPRPKAVLVISAHWVSRGSFVSSDMINTQQFDFYGFPSELYDIQVTPPGSPETAVRIMEIMPFIQGVSHPLDHGAWALLHHIFPDGKVPVLQLSIDSTISHAEYVEIGKSLAFLRNEGVLILASGNVTHNLREVSFSQNASIPEWALAFDTFVADAVSNNKMDRLVDYEDAGDLAKKAHPSNEHFLPLLYALGASEGDEAVCIYEGFQNGSISMRSWRFGAL